MIRWDLCQGRCLFGRLPEPHSDQVPASRRPGTWSGSRDKAGFRAGGCTPVGCVTVSYKLAFFEAEHPTTPSVIPQTDPHSVNLGWFRFIPSTEATHLYTHDIILWLSELRGWLVLSIHTLVPSHLSLTQTHTCMYSGIMVWCRLLKENKSFLHLVFLLIKIFYCVAFFYHKCCFVYRVV